MPRNAMRIATSNLRGRVETQGYGPQAVRLGKEFSRPGFDYFGKLEALEERLRGLLGCEVDLVEAPVSSERLQREIDKDRAVAF